MTITHFFRQHRILVFLVVVATLLRLWYLSINPLWPQFSNADDGDYFQRALRLAVTGRYVDDSWLIRPPFHVWVFAAWLKLGLLLGQPPALGVRLIQGFQLALGVLMVPLGYALATRLFNRRAGLLFAAFWAVWFPFVELPATLFSEPLYLFLFTLHLWLLLRFDDRGRLRDLALSGLVLGAAALTRSPALYALAFAVPWLLLRQWRRDAGWRLAGLGGAVRRAALPFAVLTACTLAVVLPWTLRNYLLYDRVILVDTLGPINLWLDLDAASERDAKIAQLRELPQAERQDFASARVREIISTDPWRPFRNVWPTFRHIWKAQYVEDFWVKRSFFTRPLREAAPLGLPGDLLWLLVALAGTFGVLHHRTDRPWKLLVLLWLAYSFATVLVFHVEPRYLLSIWLLLGLYAAGVLSEPRQFRAWPGSPLRRAQYLIAAGAVLGLMLLFLSYRDYSAIITRGVQREWAMWQGDQAYRAGDYPTAERWYRAALDADPGFVDTELAVALALSAQGKPSEALRSITPGASRRSTLVAGLLSRATDQDEQARALLDGIERRTGEDTQRWAIRHVPVEARSAVVLGDGALDLGYVAGFAEGEQAGARSYRWLSGSGTVQLPLTRPLEAGDSVMLEMAAPLPLDQPLELRVNGGPVQALMPAPEWRVYRLPVPPTLDGQRALRLDLRAPTHLPMASDPASADPRALSVMLHRVAVEH